jgi:hypothetical protein
VHRPEQYFQAVFQLEFYDFIAYQHNLLIMRLPIAAGKRFIVYLTCLYKSTDVSKECFQISGAQGGAGETPPEIPLSVLESGTDPR